MTPAKKKTDDRRIAPIDLEAVHSIELGPGHRRWDGGEHALGDHDPIPVEGDNGEWHHIENHEGFEFRATLCECGHLVMEGRPEESPAPPRTIAPA